MPNNSILQDILQIKLTANISNTIRSQSTCTILLDTEYREGQKWTSLGVCNSRITQKCIPYIELFSSLSWVKLVYCMSPCWNIICNCTITKITINLSDGIQNSQSMLLMNISQSKWSSACSHFVLSHNQSF